MKLIPAIISIAFLGFAGNAHAKVVVAQGADDPFLTKEQVEAFKKEMADAAVDLRLFSYPGAIHSFTNPEATE